MNNLQLIPQTFVHVIDEQIFINKSFKIKKPFSISILQLWNIFNFTSWSERSCSLHRFRKRQNNSIRTSLRLRYNEIDKEWRNSRSPYYPSSKNNRFVPFSDLFLKIDKISEFTNLHFDLHRDHVQDLHLQLEDLWIIYKRISLEIIAIWSLCMTYFMI